MHILLLVCRHTSLLFWQCLYHRRHLWLSSYFGYELGSLQRSPNPLAVFKGPTSKGSKGKGRGMEGRVEGEVKGGEGSAQLGSLDPAVEEGREGEMGKEGSLGWGVQALLFSL